MSRVGEPFIPVGTSKNASKRWHELLAQLPTELLVKTDIHELRLHCQLLALSEALSNKTETDPSDQISGRMLNQFEEIANRNRDTIVRSGLTQNHA